jgi:DNA repair exonuclease SbcCD ATPase subunit
MEGGGMNDHIPDLTKMIGETPISDSTPHNVAELGMLCRRFERELNAANTIIRQQQLLDEENLRLQERIERFEEALNELHSNEAKWLNSNGELERRIKRLEEAGDKMANSMSNAADIREYITSIHNWHKAKEAKL